MTGAATGAVTGAIGAETGAATTATGGGTRAEGVQRATGADAVRIGAHISISGGFAAMAREAVALGCEAVQVFSRSPRGGKARPLDGRDVEIMTRVLQEAGVRPLVVHVPYFINLASNDPDKYLYSRQVLAEDLERACTLRADYLVTHPGHRPSDGDAGMERVAAAVRDACLKAEGGTRVLIENTSGQGREMGDRLEDIARILDLSGLRERTGLCVDTCHAFAAGYDLRSAQAVDDFVAGIDRALGLERLFFIHINDSVYDLGSRRDRHEHIGCGKIGTEGFQALLRHPRLGGLAGVIETPVDDKESNGRNLDSLRSLRR
ncbi:MAG: deoxyribonuclease IV [Bacillota bacterium]